MNGMNLLTGTRIGTPAGGGKVVKTREYSGITFVTVDLEDHIGRITGKLVEFTAGELKIYQTLDDTDMEMYRQRWFYKVISEDHSPVYRFGFQSAHQVAKEWIAKGSSPVQILNLTLIKVGRIPICCMMEK